MRKRGRKKISCSRIQLAWIKENRSLPRSEAHAAFCKRFHKTIALGAYTSLCKRNGWITGRRRSRKQIPYSKAELAWIADNRTLPRRDLLTGFCARFERTDVDLINLNALCARMKWRTGRKRQGHKTIRYSQKELAWIEQHRTLSRRELHAAFCKRFYRREISIDHIKALCTRREWKTGRDGRLKPGNVPPNKGKKMPFNANSARTQFKKGQIPHTTKYLGHERISKDGYVEISVAEKNPHTGFERRHVQKHVHLWTQKNGPVPKGMCLKNLDGNRQNSDPSNWELIPRSLLPLMNGGNGSGGLNHETAPAEVKPLVMTLAKLKLAKNVKAKRQLDKFA